MASKTLFFWNTKIYQLSEIKFMFILMLGKNLKYIIILKPKLSENLSSKKHIEKVYYIWDKIKIANGTTYYCILILV